MSKAVKWRFAAVMADARMGRDEVAARMGVSVSSVSRYRRATMPQLDAPLLVNMCQALRCVPADLMQLEDAPDGL